MPEPTPSWLLVLLLSLSAWSGPVPAEPIHPDSALLRHDLLLLSDEGVLTMPASGWPLSTGDLADLRTPAALSAPLEAARQRVLRAVAPDRFGAGRLSGELAGLSRPVTLRGFDRLPRDDAEARAGFDWRRDRLALSLRLARVAAPDDNKAWRFDGSHAGLLVGNWWLGAGATDRWWGPGWDGSLILSNNARPVPALTLQRHRAIPFQTPWLRWLGPWTTQVIWGQLEGSRDRPNARLFGWRAGIRPLPRLELGLARTAQWCGDGRPCSASTFVDLLSGVRDNRGENVSIDNEPGNQLAGFDLRFTFDALGQPWAFYGQRIGEDEIDGLPSANLAQVGLSTWGYTGRGGSYRVHLEYANTACGGFTGGDPIFRCAYQHAIYADGYRYRGRAIGHSQDSDARMTSAGLLWATPTDNLWHLHLRRGELNRAGDLPNGAASAPTDFLDLQLSHTRRMSLATLMIGAGAEQRRTQGQATAWYGRAFVSVQTSPW